MNILLRNDRIALGAVAMGVVAVASITAAQVLDPITADCDATDELGRFQGAMVRCAGRGQ
jgi:hypothetical protein